MAVFSNMACLLDMKTSNLTIEICVTDKRVS